MLTNKQEKREVAIASSSIETNEIFENSTASTSTSSTYLIRNRIEKRLSDIALSNMEIELDNNLDQIVSLYFQKDIRKQFLHINTFSLAYSFYSS